MPSMEGFILNGMGNRYTNTMVEENGKKFHDRVKMMCFVSQAFQLLSVGNSLLFLNETGTVNCLTKVS